MPATAVPSTRCTLTGSRRRACSRGQAWQVPADGPGQVSVAAGPAPPEGPPRLGHSGSGARRRGHRPGRGTPDSSRRRYPGGPVPGGRDHLSTETSSQPQWSQPRPRPGHGLLLRLPAQAVLELRLELVEHPTPPRGLVAVHSVTMEQPAELVAVRIRWRWSVCGARGPPAGARAVPPTRARSPAKGRLASSSTLARPW